MLEIEDTVNEAQLIAELERNQGVPRWLFYRQQAPASSKENQPRGFIGGLSPPKPSHDWGAGGVASPALRLQVAALLPSS